MLLHFAIVERREIPFSGSVIKCFIVCSKFQFHLAEKGRSKSREMCIELHRLVTINYSLGMRTVFMVLAAFLLTWIPMLVLALLDMIQWLGGLGDWSPPQWLYIFAMWSMCAGSVTYPILYGIYNRAIRKELRLCLSCSGGIKNWRNNHFHGSQRRGSKWSNCSGKASLHLCA